MKKIKAFVIATSFMITGFIVGACNNTVMAEQTHPLKIWYENNNGKMETYCLVDENTDVNYIVVSGELYGYGIGVAITPRLNSDGNLYISK